MRSAEGGARRDGGVGLLLLECVVLFGTLRVIVDSTCTAAVCMVNGKKG